MYKFMRISPGALICHDMAVFKWPECKPPECEHTENETKYVDRVFISRPFGESYELIASGYGFSGKNPITVEGMTVYQTPDYGNGSIHVVRGSSLIPATYEQFSESEKEYLALRPQVQCEPESSEDPMDLITRLSLPSMTVQEDAAFQAGYVCSMLVGSKFIPQLGDSLRKEKTTVASGAVDVIIRVAEHTGWCVVVEPCDVFGFKALSFSLPMPTAVHGSGIYVHEGES